MESDIITPVSALELQEQGDGQFRARSVLSEGRSVVFGGQLVGQALVAANAVRPDAMPRQVHAIFPRAGRTDVPLDLAVTILHAGSTLTSTSVAVTQGDRVLCQATVLLDTGDSDVIRHSTPPATSVGPGELSDSPGAEHDSQVRLVEAVDLSSTDATGPAELALWARWPKLPDGNPALHCAVAAWYTEPFIIGVAMRPHEGISQAQAHRTLSTAVLSHTVTFHEPFRADEWHLLTHRAPYAGGGRVYGTGEVHTLDGSLVASFAQEAMVRAFAPSAQGGSRSAL